MPREAATDTEKYALARVEYQRSIPRDHSRTNTEYLADLLSWAIEKGFPGFEVGKDIGIAFAAPGFGTSRTSVAKAVQKLVNTGQLVVRKPKSPYRIVSKRPVISEEALPGKSYSPQIAAQEDVGDLVAPLERLGRGADAPDELLQYFRDTRSEIESRFGSVPELEGETRPTTHLVRARFHWDGGESSEPIIWWLESTLISLPTDHTEALEKAIAECRVNKRRFFSLYTYLYNLEVDPKRQIQQGSIFTDDDLVHSSKIPRFLSTRAKALIDSPYLQMPAARVPDETMIRLSFRLQAPPPAAIFGISTVFLHIPPRFPIPFVIERFRFRNERPPE